MQFTSKISFSGQSGSQVLLVLIYIWRNGDSVRQAPQLRISEPSFPHPAYLYPRPHLQKEPALIGIVLDQSSPQGVLNPRGSHLGRVRISWGLIKNVTSRALSSLAEGQHSRTGLKINLQQSFLWLRMGHGQMLPQNALGPCSTTDSCWDSFYFSFKRL